MDIIKDLLLKPYFWIIISTFIVIIYMFQKNNNFIDIKRIVSNHFKIFDKSVWQILFFTIVPILFSIGFLIEQRLNDTILNCLSVIFSILLAMFFSILAVLLSIQSNFNQKNTQKNMYNNTLLVIEQCTDTVIYEILLSIVILFLLFLFVVFEKSMATWVKYVSTFFVYTFSNSVILNIFILIKRLKSIFDKVSDVNNYN